MGMTATALGRWKVPTSMHRTQPPRAAGCKAYLHPGAPFQNTKDAEEIYPTDKIRHINDPRQAWSQGLLLYRVRTMDIPWGMGFSTIHLLRGLQVTGNECPAGMCARSAARVGPDVAKLMMLKEAERYASSVLSANASIA